MFSLCFLWIYLNIQISKYFFDCFEPVIFYVHFLPSLCWPLLSSSLWLLCPLLSRWDLIIGDTVVLNQKIEFRVIVLSTLLLSGHSLIKKILPLTISASPFGWLLFQCCSIYWLLGYTADFRSRSVNKC